ncbi:hypothetical protein ACFV3F_35175 [Streptomyces sp. NPDC059717]|uniref:hypothetical protein n=1 Tax=Streptomyces sp. NPDC059717 TaxID=3346922 RepID=UPI0036A747AA
MSQTRSVAAAHAAKNGPLAAQLIHLLRTTAAHPPPVECLSTGPVTRSALELRPLVRAERAPALAHFRRPPAHQTAGAENGPTTKPSALRAWAVQWTGDLAARLLEESDEPDIY